jgi:serine/threonine-protein kinase
MLKGRYRLDEHVAHGGMGTIYKATQVTLNRTVAVKVLLEGLNDSEEHVARFRQEADLLSRIIHPNVVALQDYGQEEGLLFMVMEFLEGQTLDGLVPAGGLSLDASLAIMEEVCTGVGAAHAAGLIHRDLKPENIFMARQKDGRSFVKVIDFGLARATASVQEAASELTMRGRVVGSAGFVAPEHITGSRDFAPASDIYALGATLYFALTGKTPHAGNDNVAIMTSQLRNIAPPLGLAAGLAQEGFGAGLERGEEHRGHFRRAVPILAQAHARLATGSRHHGEGDLRGEFSDGPVTELTAQQAGEAVDGEGGV